MLISEYLDINLTGFVPVEFKYNSEVVKPASPVSLSSSHKCTGKA
jgi:hypothetical protein